MLQTSILIDSDDSMFASDRVSQCPALAIPLVRRGFGVLLPFVRIEARSWAGIGTSGRTLPFVGLHVKPRSLNVFCCPIIFYPLVILTKYMDVRVLVSPSYPAGSSEEQAAHMKAGETCRVVGTCSFLLASVRVVNYRNRRWTGQKA